MIYDNSQWPPVDKYRRHEWFLWGALSHLHPERAVRVPSHPVLAEEFEAGREVANLGYISMAVNLPRS
jgi:hypothetical protein